MTREEREEAIKVIENRFSIMDYCESEKLGEALDMAIAVLKAEPCDEQSVYMRAYREGYDKGYADGDFFARHENEIKEPCEDAVKREAVLNTLDTMDKALDENRTVEAYKELLKECYKELPSVSPETPVAHWVAVDDEPHEWYECDHCGYSFTTKSANIMPEEENKYCPNCGRKMEEGEPK